MPYAYRDHSADVAVSASGSTLEETMCAMAEGVFALMVRPGQLLPRRSVEIAVEAGSEELLLVEWLAELVAQKDLVGILFCRFEAAVRVRAEGGLALRGTAWGEPLDPARHAIGIEVKGVSLAGLRCVRTDAGWEASCVVDV